MESMKSIRFFALIAISIGMAAAETAHGSVAARRLIGALFDTQLAFEPAQASSTPLSHTYAIAHFPYGGGWSTRVLLANSGTTDATVDIAFFNQAGAATLVPLEGQPGLQGSQQLVIHPNEVQVVGAELNQRTGGSLQVAWATAASSAPLNIFSLFDSGTSATTITGAVGAQSAAPAKTFRFPVSVGGPLNYNAGLAIANPNNTSTTFTVKVLNADGTTKGSFEENLPANGQTIFVLPSKINFDASILFDGSVAVCASQPVGLVAVGFEGGALFGTAVTNDPCP